MGSDSLIPLPDYTWLAKQQFEAYQRQIAFIDSEMKATRDGIITGLLFIIVLLIWVL